VSVYSGQIFVNNRTFTVSEFMGAHTNSERSAPWTEGEAWFSEGLDCKI